MSLDVLKAAITLWANTLLDSSQLSLQLLPLLAFHANLICEHLRLASFLFQVALCGVVVRMANRTIKRLMILSATTIKVGCYPER